MKIQIKNYPLSLKMGHFQAERSFVRSVFVSLTLHTKLSEPSQLENLEKTIDYGEVLSFLDEEFANKTYRLIESLLYQIAKGLIINFSLLEELNVSIEKTFIRPQLVKGSKIFVSESFKRADFL